MHKSIDPAILYFGTPVVLVSSLNEDGTPNVAPMSSAWWLGWSCLLGFGARSKTPANRVHPSRLAEIPESAYRPRPRPVEAVVEEKVA